MDEERQKLDLYISKQYVSDLPIAYLLRKHQVKIFAQGFLLEYVNIFGSACQAAIDEFKALPHCYVNVYPPDIQQEIDREFQLEESWE